MFSEYVKLINFFFCRRNVLIWYCGRGWLKI